MWSSISLLVVCKPWEVFIPIVGLVSSSVVGWSLMVGVVSMVGGISMVGVVSSIVKGVVSVPSYPLSVKHAMLAITL